MPPYFCAFFPVTPPHSTNCGCDERNRVEKSNFCQTPVLGLRLGVDFTFAWDNNNNDKKNPHLNFLKRNSMRGYGMKDKG